MDKTSKNSRFKSLDALRGIAAVIVLLSHATLITLAHITPNVQPSPLWGPQAVLIFFIISGFVLPLPFLKGKTTWLSYYPSRILRLYIPTLASILLAATLLLIVPRTGTVALTNEWINTFNELSFSWGSLREHLLFTSEGFYLNTPVWSIVFEIFFSLLLPFYLFYVKSATDKIAIWFNLVLMLSVSTLGTQLDNLAIRCMPVFALGVIVAVNFDYFSELFTNMKKPTIITLTILSSLGFFIIDWFGYLGESFWVKGLPFGFTLSSCFVLFCIVLFKGQKLVNKFTLWLGDISFSLYLVHVPVLVTTVFIFPSELLPLSIIIGVILSFLIAVIFRMLIEKPSHKLSQIIGKRLRGNHL